MKAVALTRYLPISDPQALLDVQLERPVPGSRDLLVKVVAISVNPIDTKVRRSKLGSEEAAPRVLGWDAAGIVEAVGADVSLFRPGDHVYYAGSLTRPGANCEYHAVDERIVGRKPSTLSFVEAAALPLTSLTAWECFFERLGIDRGGAHRGRSLLIIGGAGGVGSIGIQLAKLAGVTVIATASRPETQAWVRELGADRVIDHRQPLAPQLKEAGHAEVDFIANFSSTDAYWPTMAEVIKPQGKIVCIVGNDKPLAIELIRQKSVTFVWELMFTRAMYGTEDMQEQHAILNEVALLLEAGHVRTTLRETLSPINAANLREAHARMEAGTAVGKIGVEGW